ncbi:L domain-like protein [Lentithecium fluviatile CBS 122367]|uniref:L domain-like protein n=1 Tax=Lentithecium fluviatile CBS 122367 TaxID=1168545 RepID=A0A6G1JAB2_9PLEO|nr:L domain-like protein [Lentithecium fluviatile CBS 122367]
MSNGRPMTSDGTPQAVPITPRRIAPPASRGSMTVPGKRSVSAATTTSAIATPSKTTSLARPASMIRKQPLSQMQNVQAATKPRPLSNSKTMVARTPKSRPSIAGTFGQAISPPGTAIATTPSPARMGSVSKTTPVTSRKVSSSSAALRDQIAKAKAARRSDAGSDLAPKSDETPPKVSSSQALREQIAKARAAKRANATRDPRTSTPTREAIVPDPAEIAGFDFGLEDPFNQGSKGSKSLLRKRLDGARADGRLNIAAMGLSEIPSEVLGMYKYDADDKTVAWGEVVDLTVIIAADNEFQTLPVEMFPDVDYEAAADSDDDGPQFGGIQNFDLHGNMLRELSVGLRRLTQLSKLNLSRNKLPLGVLDIVTQITSLRELKLAENALEGDVPSSLENLVQLETLDLQGNKLTSLPPEVRALTHLRSLNISENKLAALPNELFTSVPIVELIASKNAFGGSFFDVDTVPHLQKLHLSNNSLTELCVSGTILLPALKHLDVSLNRMSNLPDMSSWTSLTTLLVGENNLSTLPEGFLTLQQLRNADFTGNNLNKLDERIALMEALENLTLAANPLRDRKFLTMNTEDIKRDLLSRIEPERSEQGESETFVDASEEITTEVNGWKLTPSGTLDLSFQNLTEVDEEAVVSFSTMNDVRQLYLQQNYLTQIPVVAGQLSFLTVLDLSKNSIVNPLTENLELPKLREFRLSGNKIASFDDLNCFLSAPNLQHLDLSHNRLTGSLPSLREFFPALMLFIASDNSISEVSAESLQGLKTVNLSNNDIGRLEPRIGLHMGTLTSLDVEGNKFRVPNYAVLKKGTDAILNWLRDKIPSPTEEFFDPGSPGY